MEWKIIIIDKDGGIQEKSAYVSNKDKNEQKAVAKWHVDWAREVGYLDEDTEVTIDINKDHRIIKIYVPGAAAGAGGLSHSAGGFRNRRKNRKTKKSSFRKARKTRRVRG